uniref:Type I-A CRISPR-associated protein Cas4/Csa1 n=1 Tax=Ignisphaera aggregans TaxID=334771 RepID=A0A7J2U5P4_9CREN
MLSLSNLTKALKKLQSIRADDPVDEDLRGWNWHKPPVKPRAYLNLAVSEIVYRFCSTKRDLWLKRVGGAKPVLTEVMRRGIAIHEAIHRSAKEVGKAIAIGLTPWRAYEYAVSRWRRVSREIGVCDRYVEDVYRLSTFMWASLAAELNGSTPLTEYMVNGSLLGLSRTIQCTFVAV